MPDTWILVADHARARLFSLEHRAGRMGELESFANVEARTPGHERERAPPPRTHDRLGEGRHVIEPHTTARDKSAAQFAGTLASVLARGLDEQRYVDLVLIAPPRFLGILNASLRPRVREAVALKIAKNLVRRSVSTIRVQIPRRLALRGPLPQRAPA